MGVIFLSNCISVSLSLCSCIPLYNFSYIYEYIMSTPTSFVDRWVSWLRYIDVRILKIISCWLSPVHHSLLQDLCGYLKLATFCSGIRWLFYVLRNINVSLKWSYLCYSLLRYMRYILLSFWFGVFLFVVNDQIFGAVLLTQRRAATIPEWILLFLFKTGGRDLR